MQTADDGTWMRVGDGKCVDLANRPGLARLLACSPARGARLLACSPARLLACSPARLLAALAALASSSPFPVSSDALIALGWSGERLVLDAGQTRLRVATSTLRRLGLDPCLVTSRLAEATTYSLHGVISN